MFTGLIAKMGQSLNEMYKKKIVYKSLHERLGLVPEGQSNTTRPKTPPKSKPAQKKRARTPPGPNLAIQNMMKKAMEDRMAEQLQLKLLN